MPASSVCCSGRCSGPQPSSRPGVLEPGVGQGDVSRVLVDAEVDARPGAAATACGDDLVRQRRRRRLARDDERHARLVDQDEVGLVHDDVVERPLHDVGRVGHRLVAEEVEAGLLRRHVGDVGRVRGAPLVAAHPLRDRRDRQAELPVDGPHPGGVAAGQVVVGREDVHAPPGERVQRGGQHGHQRLAFAGRHLREPALVKSRGRHHLHVERPQPEAPRAGLARERVDGGQQVVERFTVLRPPSQPPGLFRDGGVGHPADVDRLDPAERVPVGAEVVLDRRAAQLDEGPVDRLSQSPLAHGRSGRLPTFHKRLRQMARSRCKTVWYGLQARRPGRRPSGRRAIWRSGRRAATTSHDRTIARFEVRDKIASREQRTEAADAFTPLRSVLPPALARRPPVVFAGVGRTARPGTRRADLVHRVHGPAVHALLPRGDARRGRARRHARRETARLDARLLPDHGLRPQRAELQGGGRPRAAGRVGEDGEEHVAAAHGVGPRGGGHL